MKYVFEISWEVCNKVGGIHTVISTKVEEALKEYGEAYFTLGPDLGQTHEFLEVDMEADEQKYLKEIKAILDGAGIKTRIGRWDVAGKPPLILIGGFIERFNIDKLLYSGWQHYGVDSYEGGWDYIEPVLFSSSCGEAIELIVKNKLDEHRDQAVAHFHEWICGAGILYLDRNMPNIGTIFTTHATVLGRAIAHTNPFYYHEMELSQNVHQKAHERGVKSKHSLEAAAAKTADCFTTVSEFTSREAFLVLDQKPDMVVYNGLNFKDLPKYDKKTIAANRTKILETCSAFLEEQLPGNTQIWLSSGRYEYRNKGYDLILEALADIKKRKGNDIPPVLVLFAVAADHGKANVNEWNRPEDSSKSAIALNSVYQPEHDAIINTCKRLSLDEKASPVKVVFSTLYFDGDDGILNIPYNDILQCVDLSLFPSFYEPWGYTPLESIAMGVPTVTSDLSGFGHWIETLDDDWDTLVKVVHRRNRADEEAISLLSEILEKALFTGLGDKAKLLKKAKQLAEIIDWSEIYHNYVSAYDIALAKGHHRSLACKDQHLMNNNPLKDGYCTLGSNNPSLHCLELKIDLPVQLAGLNSIVQNLWWSWNDEAKAMFKSISPNLWNYFDHNPIKLLKSVPYAELDELQSNEEFMLQYQAVHKQFKDYMGTVFVHELVDRSKPVISYFSMEYGIHECLPIYSGGLGILSGDHIKAASDMALNMVGIGLFYNNGYYIQEINGEGRQIEHYPHLDWSTLPLKLLLNQFGEPVKIPVEFPGRKVWARVIVAHVGRVPLFLFDTDIDDNSQKDRAISSKLYTSDREQRIQQEMLVGIAGIRLLKDVLNIDSAVYHLNEGHCAFMSVELIRRLTQHGYSLDTAIEAIKTNTMFTTHTPVPAGNEAFDVSLIRDAFSDFFNTMQVSLDKFIELGLSEPGSQEFSMTILALRISVMANAVSALHGEVSRDMWKHVVAREDFIQHVTNGVHLDTWMGKEIEGLFLDPNFTELPNEVVWKKHQSQKQTFIDELKIKILDEYTRKGIGMNVIKTITDKLSTDTLLIGFARRFASYKRADLLLADKDRLRKILNSSDKPATIVFAGKAHPADGVGKDLIHDIYQTMLEEEFSGRIILLENYNMYWGALMTQGVDLWLNTPILGKEACGTSGMKAAMNGVLNFSLPDGWWYEGQDPKAGFTITPIESENLGEMNQKESSEIYDILERDILPLYYGQDGNGIPNDWVKMMKASIARYGVEFAAKRMLEDYNGKMYKRIIGSRNLVTY